MSEPLYRIWSIQYQRYLYFSDAYYVNLYGDIQSYIGNAVEQEQYIVQRCTGEIVNDKYIYEGDIVLVGKDVCTVEFGYGNFIVNSLYTYREYEVQDIDKIIGKNLENPELLLERDETDET